MDEKFIKIPLGKNHKSKKFAMINESDLEKLKGWTWGYDRGFARGYCRRGRGKEYISMHRLLVGAEAKSRVYHVNKDKLDNRRSNLRGGRLKSVKNTKTFNESVLPFGIL